MKRALASVDRFTGAIADGTASRSMRQRADAAGLASMERDEERRTKPPASRMRPWPVLLVTAASAGVTAYLGFFAFLLLIYAQPQLFVVVALLAGAQVAFWKWTENRAAAWSLAQTVAALAGYSLGYVALLVAGFVVLRVPVYVE